ncbi:hypothetical protein D3C80_2149850 [compost metagenome]
MPTLGIGVVKVRHDSDVAGLFVDGAVLDELELARRQGVVVRGQEGASQRLLGVLAQ